MLVYPGPVYFVCVHVQCVSMVDWKRYIVTAGTVMLLLLLDGEPILTARLANIRDAVEDMALLQLATKVCVCVRQQYTHTHTQRERERERERGRESEREREIVSGRVAEGEGA